MPRLLLACLLACASAMAGAAGIDVQELRVDAPGLADAPLRVRVYVPPDYAVTQARYEVLYVNDGQDMEAVAMAATLERLYAGHQITRIIVVAIDMPPDRMAGYGLFDRARGQAIVAQTKYGAVGSDARIYADWLTTTLLPRIDAHYRTRASADGRAILGWSLGALSAFGIGWQYPETFGRVGAFSPSFWLSADNRDARAVQATRIAHRLVAASAPMARPKLFLGVGTREEESDRDSDGVIDVLDDARDLVEGWATADGVVQKGVRQAVRRGDEPTLFVLAGGRHEQSSWARMLPVFLQWAYAPKAPQAPG